MGFMIGILLQGVTVFAGGDLTVTGTINAGTGGVKFSDGSVQNSSPPISTTHAPNSLLKTDSDGFAGVISKVVLTSPATTINLTGLDGDTHQFYELIIFSQRTSGNSAYLQLRFNNDAASHYHFNGTASGGPSAEGQIGWINNIGSIHRVIIKAQSGTERTVISYGGDNGTNSSGTQLMMVGWADSTSNITSIQLISTNGGTNCFAPGTIAIVRRLF